MQVNVKPGILGLLDYNNFLLLNNEHKPGNIMIYFKTEITDKFI